MEWPRVGLVWPSTVDVPSGPPLVYLDLNHWINLSRASLGKGAESYEALLAACEAAKRRGAARFVLSLSLVEELSAISNPRQRAELVAVIERLSGFEYLAGLPDIMRLELQALLDQRTDTVGPKLGTLPLVGRSMLHAFGKVGGLRIHDEATGADITDRLRAEGGEEFERLHRDLELRAERELLTGPDDELAQELRASGYRPEVPRQRMRDNVTIEQAFADEHLDAHWRKGRLADLLAVRHVSLELIDMLNEELVFRQMTISTVLGAMTSKLELPLAMPSSAIYVAMKGHYHRNSHRKWSVNDLHDIGAMAIAVPYCDIVFTDAEARSALVATGQVKSMNTVMPRTPADLANLLGGLGVPSPRGTT